MTANDFKRLEQLENDPKRTPDQELDLIELKNRDEIFNREL